MFDPPTPGWNCGLSDWLGGCLSQSGTGCLLLGLGDVTVIQAATTGGGNEKFTVCAVEGY